ncbi:MAG: serine hydrolase [Myxococcota bacterium]
MNDIKFNWKTGLAGILGALAASACSAANTEEAGTAAHVQQEVTATIWSGSVPGTGIGLGNFVNSVNDLVRNTMVANNHVGVTVAATKDGRLIYSGAFGYSNWQAKTLMQSSTRAQIGSSTKVETALAMMKLVHDRADVGLGSHVYGSDGILKDQEFEDAYVRGTRRHYPLVGITLNRDNHVLAYYSDGMFTEGTSENLQQYAGPTPFTLPPGKGMQDLVAIAQGGADNKVYSWYMDGKYAVGTPTNLGALVGDFKSETKDHLVAVTVDTRANVFYAYSHDGVVTSGDSPADLTNRWTKEYTVPGDQQRRYDIVSVGRSDNGVMVAWYSDGQASKGNATSLGATTALYPYERRSVPGSRDEWLDAYRNIEIQHLLSHTSGFSRSGEREQADEMFNVLPVPISDYKYSNLYVLATRPLLFKPGTAESYSNHGMGLTGYLIERLTGQTWYDYLRANILIPAGADNIYPNGFDFDADRDSRPHQISSSGIVTTLPAETRTIDPGSSAGALKATAADLCKVMVATDRLTNHPDVLPSSVLDVMESRPFADKAPTHALGWQIGCESKTSCAQKKLWHNGSVDDPDNSFVGSSYLAKYQNVPLQSTTVDGITVAVVSNREGADGFRTLSDSIAATIAKGSVNSSGDLFIPIQ